MQFNIHEAKTQLSLLAERVLKGERIVIAKAGMPCIDLVPHNRHEKPRQPGRYKDQVVMEEDFDSVNDDIQTLFEGDS